MTWRDSARERKLARRSANVNVVSVMDGAKIPRRLTHMRDALRGALACRFRCVRTPQEGTAPRHAASSTHSWTLTV